MKNTNIVVSTITSCYKGKKYLKTFLENLPKQSFFNQLEIVLAHNEPDNEELEWVKNFQKKYPQHLKHIIFEKVTPLGTSWNTCINNASGNLLTIWNIDDTRTTNSIEVQAQELINNNTIDIVYGDYATVKTFGSTNSTLIKHEHIPESEFTRSMIWGPFFMFRKSIIEKAGYFDEQFKSALDLDFTIRLALHGKAKHVKQNLGYFLNAGTGLSTNANTPNNIERTAIELRYGIYDKIDYSCVPEATTMYDIKTDIYVPHYTQFIQTRKKLWFDKGIKNFYLRHKKQHGFLTKGKKMLKKLLGKT
jgi:glycosyltransferase involved in cell wall biosynthesis